MKKFFVSLSVFAALCVSAFGQSPDLSLRFGNVGDRLFVGAEGLITLLVSNAGPASAPAVRITNVFSSGTVVRSVTPSPESVTDQTYVFALGAMTAQTNRTLQFVVTTFDPLKVCADATVSDGGIIYQAVSWCAPEFRSLSCFPQLDDAVVWLNGDGTTASFDTTHADPHQFQGVLEYAPGVSGRAFKFNGTDAAALPVFATGPNSFDASFALVLWVQTTQSVVSATLAELDALGTNSPRFGLRLNHGKPEWFVADADSTGTEDTLLARPRFVADGLWHQIVGVRDLAANELRCYVDGQLSVRHSLTGRSDGPLGAVSPQPITLGARRSGGSLTDFLNGSLDDLVFFLRAPGDAEVAAWYAALASTNTDCFGPVLSPAAFSTARAGQPFWSTVRLFTSTPGVQWWLDPASLPSNLCWTTTGELRGSPGVGQYSIRFGLADGGGHTTYVSRPLHAASSAPSGLVAFWPGDGSGGESVNGQSVTAVGNGTGFIDGVRGQAFRLLGSPNYFTTPQPVPNAPRGNSARTLMCWVWREPGRNDGGSIAGQSGFPVASFDFTLVQAGGPVGLLINGTMISGPRLERGRWTHLAATQNGATARLYVDGQLAGERPIIPTASSTGGFFVGGGFGGPFFSGAVDEVALFNRALSAGEIIALMNDGVPAATPLPPGGLPLAVNALAATELPTAFLADPYAFNITNHFCGVPASYLIVSGLLPASLSLSNDGTIGGVPAQTGHFTFTVRGFDALGRSADVLLGLEVRLRPPHFTRSPLSREMELGRVLWLAADTDIPATFQWFFNNAELPGQTNNYFIEPSFAAYNAGVYQVRARNAAGDTFGPPAEVRVRQALAQREGVVLARPTFTPSRKLQLQFSTVPGRKYKIQRAANGQITGNTSWQTLEQMTATGYTFTHLDNQLFGAQSGFYRIVEEQADQPGAHTLVNPNFFVPLDSLGRPQLGTLVGRTGNLLGSFEFRPGGIALPSGLGLCIRAPDGGTVMETNGETRVELARVQLFFGPDSPIQFAEPLEFTDAELPVGPLSVEQIEALLHKPHGSGLEIILFGKFHLRLVRGTFDGSKIRGARVELLPDATHSIPLPGMSGDYPGFDIDLGANAGVRIPFYGSFTLPDETSSPATLTVPRSRPLVLDLRADGHIGISGHADVEFAGGPRFAVDFSFSDPDYRLRLAARGISLPPLLGISDLLPGADPVSENADDAALDLATEQIANAESAALEYAALTAGDAETTSANAGAAASANTAERPGGGGANALAIPVQSVASGVVNVAELAARAAVEPAAEIQDPPYHPPHVKEPWPERLGVAVPRDLKAQALPTAESPTPAAGPFEALTDDGGTLPPDTDGAVGRTKLLVTHNGRFRVQNKADGRVISTFPITIFWNSMRNHADGRLEPSNDVFDPKAIYDPFHNRWIVTAIADRKNANSSLLIGISESDDPTGRFFLFRVPASTPPFYPDWADFPTIGFNRHWVAVNVNMYTSIGDEDAGVKMFVFDYGQLRAGTCRAALFTGPEGPTFTSSPAATYDPDENTLYVVSHVAGADGTYRVDTITGTPSAPVYRRGAIKNRGNTWFDPSGDILPQAAPMDGMGLCNGVPCPLHCQDAHVRASPVMRNGFLYYAQTIGLPAGVPTRTAIQWTKLDARGGVDTGKFLEGGCVEDPTATAHNGGKWYAYPHLAVNQNRDIILGFSQFSSAQFPSAGYAFHHHTDAAGSMRIPHIYVDGLDYYRRVDRHERNRWGDYSKAQVDPNGADLWVLQEYAAAQVDGQSRWGTAWAKVAVTGPGSELANMLEPGAGDLLTLWRNIAQAKGFAGKEEQIEAAVGRASRMAAGSDDWREVTRALANLAALQRKGRDDNADGVVAMLKEAISAEAAAMQRIVDSTPCSQYTPLTINQTLSNIFYTVEILERYSDQESQTNDLLRTANQLLDCYAKFYVADLGVERGVPVAAPGSRIAKMHRYEAMEHLRQLLALHTLATQLGFPGTLNSVPIADAFSQLGRAAWLELKDKLQTALTANEARTAMALSTEVLDFKRLLQARVIPQGDDWPTSTAVDSLITRLFQNGPVEIAAQDVNGERLSELRDDLKRFVDLLSFIPDNVGGDAVPPAVPRNYDALQQRIERIVPQIAQKEIFGTADLIALLEAGLFGEEIRLRFFPVVATLWPQQLDLLIAEIGNRVRAEDNWNAAHLATAALMEAAQRAAQRSGASPAPGAGGRGGDDPGSIAYRLNRRTYLAHAAILTEAERSVASGLGPTAEQRAAAGLPERLVDMLLPGGIEIDEAAGELRYNSRARAVSGAFNGKLRLPGQGLTLNLINASFHSGGAMDVSLTGSFKIPAQDPLVTLTIPPRHPLHLAVDLSHHVTIEGGLHAKLNNGMEFEAWASLNDPWYTFGAAARGLSFNVGSNLVLNLQVPDEQKLRELGPELGELVIDYLGAAGGALEPLRNVQALPDLPPLGEPPAYRDEVVSFESDTLAAAVGAFRILVADSTVLGFNSLENAVVATTNIAAGVRRELDTRRGKLLDLRSALADARQREELEDRRNERRAALDKLLAQARALKANPVSAFHQAAPGVTGDFLNQTDYDIALEALRDTLGEAMADSEAAIDADSARKIVEIAALLRAAEMQPPVSPAPPMAAANAAPPADPAIIATFTMTARRAVLAELGLNPDSGAVRDANLLGGASDDALKRAATELSQQEATLQLCMAEDNARYKTAIAQIYAARRDIATRKKLDLEARPLTPPHNLEIVRKLQIMTEIAALALDNEQMAQLSGASGPITIKDIDGTTKTVQLEDASASMTAFIADDIDEVNGFAAKMLTDGGTTEERRLWDEFVRPELERVAKDQQKGVPAIVGPARTLIRTPRRPLPSEVLAKLSRGLEQLARARLDALIREAKRAQENSLTPAADLLQLFSSAVGVAELIDLTTADTTKTQLLTLLQTEFFTRVTVKLTGTAAAQKAWWYSQRAAKLLAQALNDQAYQNSTQLRDVFEAELDHARTNLVSLIGVLRDDIQSRELPVDLMLPGNIHIADVHGEVTFNRSTRFVRGSFGGRLEFPDLHDSFLALDELTLDTDGRFRLRAHGSFSPPVEFPRGSGLEHPRFVVNTLSAEGQRSPNPTDFNGFIKFMGNGSVSDPSVVNGPRVMATVGYEQVIDGEDFKYKFSFSLSGHVNLSFGDDFFLFDASIGGATGNNSDTTVRVGGKAGLFVKEEFRPLLTNSALVTPEMFQLLIEEVSVAATLATSNNVGGKAILRLESGRLRLPPLFENLDPKLCTGAIGVDGGAEIGLAPGKHIEVAFDPVTARVTFGGDLTFKRIGFPIPFIEGMQAAICSATLHFADDEFPSLKDVNGSLKIPLPNQPADNYLDLVNAQFSLTGLSVGTISLRHDFLLGDLGGVKLAILGMDNAAHNPACGTSLMITNNPPSFKFQGGLRLTVPSSLFSSNDMGTAGSEVSGTVCGSLQMTFPPNATPDVALDLSTFKIEAASLRLGGSGGVVIKNAKLELQGINNLFTPTREHPFTITVGGGIQLPNGPLLGLSNATLRLFDPDRLPEFAIQSLYYDGTKWEFIQGMPLQVTKGAFVFKDPFKPLPDRFAPSNVKLIISAGLYLPSKTNTIFGGAVDDLTIEFEANGLPKLPTVDGFEVVVQPGGLDIPPMSDMGGAVHVGGLQAALMSGNPSKIYMVGRMSGSYSTYKLAYLCAFTLTGPVGMCLDVNAGTAGIPIGPTGIIISGAQGGLSFVNSGADPCKFDSYFVTDPVTGQKKLNSNSGELPEGILPRAMSWEQLKQIADDMKERAQQFVRPPQMLVGGGPKAAQAPSPVTISPECSNCPPATINILCQPHPDQIKFANRVIVKFTALDEHTITNLMHKTRDDFTGNAADVAANIGSNAASAMVEYVRAITPPVSSAIGDASFRMQLEAAQSNALVILSNGVITAVHDGLVGGTGALYDRFIGLIAAGIPCQDITVVAAARVSYLGIGTFAYVEGKAIVSSAGSAGVIGTLNVIGVPLGQAKVFVAATDAKGELNPSICGEVKVGLGPLEVGNVQAQLMCEGCLTQIIGVFPKIAAGMSEELLRELASRVAPSIENIQQMSRAQIIAALTSQTNAQVLIAGFFAELLRKPPEALPYTLRDIMVREVSNVLTNANPVELFCGEIRPRLFGFPLTPGGVSFAMQADLSGYFGEFTFPPSIFLMMPPVDQAKLSFDLRAQSPGYYVVAAIDGTFSSPQRAGQFAEDQFNYALEHTTFGLDYQFHPFGMRIADAGARVLMPDLVNHPVKTLPARKPAWETDATLPRPADLLVRAASSNLLGNAFDWKGNKDDFAKIYPEGSPEHNALMHLDLRKDYFPYGGILGGGQLNTPLILYESPNEWLPLLADMQTNTPINKITSAIELVTKHILATTNNGEIAFYLPAPNPPMLYGPDGSRLDEYALGTNGISRAHLTPKQIIESIRQFDGAKLFSGGFQPPGLQVAPIYPAEYAFATGHLRGDFLGIEIGQADFFARLLPAPGSEDLAVVTATAPKESWIGKVSGDHDVSLRFRFSTPPSNTIDAAFNIVSNSLWHAADGLSNNASLNVDSTLTFAFAQLATALPRVAFEATLPSLAVSASGDPSPATQLLPPAIWIGDPYLAGYSPMYDTNIAPTTISNRVRHDGGLFAAAKFAFSLDSPAHVQLAASNLASVPLSLFEVGRAELGFTPQPNGVPRLSGFLSNINVHTPAPFTRMTFAPTADAEFDSAANPALIIRGAVAPIHIGLNGQEIFNLENAAGGTELNAELSVNRSASPTVPPVVTAKLDPVKLNVPVLGSPDLIFHGTGNTTNRIEISSGGTFSARASFRPPGLAAGLAGGAAAQIVGCPGRNIDLKVGDLRLAKICGLPDAAFKASGHGLDDFTLNLGFSSLDHDISVELFPDPNNPPGVNIPAGLKSFSLPVRFGPAVALRFECGSDGRFKLTGKLTAAVQQPPGFPSFPGLKSGATVIINNEGIQFDGYAPADSAKVHVMIGLDGAMNADGQFNVGPWTWGCITLSASGGASFHASEGVPDGIDLTGDFQFNLCNIISSDGFQTPSLNALHLNPNGYFCTNIAGLANVPLNFAGYPVKVTSLNLCGVRSDGEHADEYVRLDFGGTLDLSPALVADVFGHVAYTNTAGGQAVNDGGFHLEIDSHGVPHNVLGLPFANFTASLIGSLDDAVPPLLHLSGDVPFLPDEIKHFSGDLGPDTAFNLVSQIGNLPNSLGFALNNAASGLKYHPGTYKNLVLGQGGRPAPVGYWRMDDLIDTSHLNSMADSSPAGGANGSYFPSPTLFFSPAPQGNEDGAFEVDNNKSVRFGAGFGEVRLFDNYATVPMPPGNPGRFNKTNAFTVELWFKRQSGAPLGTSLSQRQVLAEHGDQWSLTLGGSGTPAATWLVFGCGGVGALGSTSRFDDTNWHHIVAVFDSAAQYLYVDGRFDNWQATQGNLRASNNRISLAASVAGSGGTPDLFYSGWLDEVAVYDKALSPVDVLDHYLAGGHGGIRLEADFGAVPFFSLDGGAGLKGIIGADGSLALAMQTPRQATFSGFPGAGLQLPGFSGNVLKAAGGNALFNFSASLPPPPLPGVSGSAFNVKGTLASSGNFNFSGAGNRLDLLQAFALDQVTLSAWRNNGTLSNSMSGRLLFPRYLGGGDLSLSGSLMPLSLGSSGGKEITIGPGQFDLAYSLNETTISGSGQYLAGNISVGGGFTATAGGVQFTASGDTGWKEARGIVRKFPCTKEGCLFRVCGCIEYDFTTWTDVEESLSPPWMRFEWSLRVQATPDWESCITGRFRVDLDQDGDIPAAVDVNPGASSCLSIGADGRLAIDQEAEGLKKFLPKLW